MSFSKMSILGMRRSNGALVADRDPTEERNLSVLYGGSMLLYITS